MAKGFFIYFTGRCGSTFLIHRLRNHPNITAYGEVFGAEYIRDNIEQTGQNQIEFVRETFRPYRKESHKNFPKSRGLKIQFNKRVPDLQSKEPRRLINNLSKYDLVHIHLTRENTVKQVISSMRAEAFAKYSRENLGQEYANLSAETLKDNPEIKFSPMEVDAKVLIHKCRVIENTNEWIKDLLSPLDNVHHFTYEGILENKNAFFREFFSLVDVEQIEFPLEEELIKMTSSDLSESISNFEKLKQEIKSTKYYDQLVEK